MDENNVVLSPALELGLKLFEHSMAENAKLAQSIMEYKDNKILDLETDLKSAVNYIYYVQDCINLHVIPRTYNYWYNWIWAKGE